MELLTCGIAFDEERHPVLVREAAREYRTVNMESPKQITEMMYEIFDIDRKMEEYTYLIACDHVCHPLYLFELSHGKYNCSLTGLKEIFIRVLLCGASHIVLIHNHPGGDPAPSGEDFQITEKIKRGADYLELRLMDHIIIGSHNYYSFMEHMDL